MPISDHNHFDSLTGKRVSRHMTLSEQKRTERARLDAQIFFKNPVEKALYKRRFPMKLSLQIAKIFVVTVQLILFSSLSQNHLSFRSETMKGLKVGFYLVCGT